MRVKSIDCIIPFYNEDRYNLFEIIKTVDKVKEVNKIVIVDDGSESKDCFDFLTKKYKGQSKIRLLRLAKNYGKSFAVEYGLSVCDSEHIFLLDADLKNLKTEVIKDAINSVWFFCAEMVILRNMKSLPLIKLIRADTLLSGQRIIKTVHLKNVFKKYVEDYQLEIAINQYFIDSKIDKKCYWSPSFAENNYKFRKIGFFKGISKDLKMYSDIISYIGIKKYIKQYLYFCKAGF